MMLSDKQKAREDVQASYFTCRLWVETESYDTSSVLASVADSFDQWAYALHDQDIDDGKPVKPHYHVVFRNRTEDGKCSSTTIGAVANILGITSDNIQAGKNDNDNRGFDGCVRYLIHDTEKAKQSGKFQYDRSIICSNLSEDYFDRLFKSANMATKIITYILTEHPRTFTQLCKWAIDNNCWLELRRSQYAFSKIMDEVKNVTY